jgi:hypothetical protein
MTPNLFHERFYSWREPAWHTLGHVSQEPLQAVEAYSTINPYDLSLESLLTASGLTTVFRVIIREPVPDSPQRVTLGIPVGPDYTLVTPMDICEAYDRGLPLHPVETIGALGEGETFFLTTLLSEMDINGDVVKVFLLIVSLYTGMASIQVRLTPVRVCCQNTLIAAKQASTEFYRIRHDAKAIVNLQSWMVGLYERSRTRFDFMQSAFRAFAQKSPTPTKVINVIETIYKLPEPPAVNAPEDIMAVREHDYEYYKKDCLRSRDAVQELFNGAGVGSDTQAFRGTYWGLYNSVAEWENYHIGLGGKEEGKAESRAKNTLFGTRGALIERAYNVIDGAIQEG